MAPNTQIERIIAQNKGMGQNTAHTLLYKEGDLTFVEDVQTCDAAIGYRTHKQNFLKLCQFMQAEYEENFNYEELGYTKDAVLAAQARLQRTTNDVMKNDILQGMLESAVQAIWFVAANLDQSKMQKEVAVPEKEASHAG